MCFLEPYNNHVNPVLGNTFLDRKEDSDVKKERTYLRKTNDGEAGVKEKIYSIVTDKKCLAFCLLDKEKVG